MLTYQNLPVLVTGGAGFIGSHLTRGLLAAGAKVRILDNLSHGSLDNLRDIQPHIDFRQGDLRTLDDCKAAAQNCAVIFHLAALGSVPRSVEQPLLYNDVDVTGTLHILEAARAAGAKRVVYSASSSAYGDTPILPKIETMSPSPKSPYAVAKLASEHYCRAYSEVYKLSTCCLRYFNVFGPRQNPNSQYAAVIPAFIDALLHNRAPKIYGDGEQTRDFCFVGNVVKANMLAGSSEKSLAGESVNIACGENISLNAMLAKMQKILGTHITPEYLPPRAGDVRDSLADISAARQLLDYTPDTYFNQGLEITVKAYAAQPLPA
ncbi:MAG TPA: SDR family oxidoreductase [Phycisphaerae bacterium]|nr:SDR family oxidoreductase [Phycisphaerae bacterium]